MFQGGIPIEDFNDAKREVAEFVTIMYAAQTSKIAMRAQGLQAKLGKLHEQSVTFNNKEAAFDVPATDYKGILAQQKQFEPFLMPWTTVDQWHKTHDKCMKEPFILVCRKVEKNVELFRRAIAKCTRSPHIKNNSGARGVEQEVFAQIEEFKPKMHIIMSLANEGMPAAPLDCHFGQARARAQPNDAELTQSKALSNELQLNKHIVIQKGEKRPRSFRLRRRSTRWRTSGRECSSPSPGCWRWTRSCSSATSSATTSCRSRVELWLGEVEHDADVAAEAAQPGVRALLFARGRGADARRLGQAPVRPVRADRVAGGGPRRWSRPSCRAARAASPSTRRRCSRR